MHRWYNVSWLIKRMVGPDPKTDWAAPSALEPEMSVWQANAQTWRLSFRSSIIWFGLLDYLIRHLFVYYLLCHEPLCAKFSGWQKYAFYSSRETEKFCLLTGCGWLFSLYPPSQQLRQKQNHLFFPLLLLLLAFPTTTTSSILYASWWCYALFWLMVVGRGCWWL